MSQLRDRRVVMSAGDVQTAPIKIPNHGVSQGAVLSPILFAACTRRIRECLLAAFKLPQFSDDSVLWMKCKGKNLSPLRLNNMQTVFNKIVSELNLMGLAIEPIKTVHMLINSKKGSKARLLCDCKEIARVKSVKFLGIIIQEKKGWIHP